MKDTTLISPKMISMHGIFLKFFRFLLMKFLNYLTMCGNIVGKRFPHASPIKIIRLKIYTRAVLGFQFLPEGRDRLYPTWPVGLIIIIFFQTTSYLCMMPCLSLNTLSILYWMTRLQISLT